MVHEAYNQEEEADFVAKQVLELQRRHNIRPGSCAVMYRINAQSRALEEACLRLGIKYRIIGGIQFYRRREIRDLMAYLCVLHNPQDDVNLARAIGAPTRGIGERTMQELNRWALGQRHPRLWRHPGHRAGPGRRHPLPGPPERPRLHRRGPLRRVDGPIRGAEGQAAHI